MWTDTYLQTSASAGPSGQFWGSLKSLTRWRQFSGRGPVVQDALRNPSSASMLWFFSDVGSFLKSTAVTQSLLVSNLRRRKRHKVANTSHKPLPV